MNGESHNDEKIAEMLKGLGAVEAPPDFTVRVKSRIASRRSVQAFPLRSILRIAVPVAAMLIVVGIVWFSGIAEDPARTVAVAEPDAGDFIRPIEPGPKTSSNVIETVLPQNVPDRNATARNDAPANRQSRPEREPDREGGSTDFAVRGSDPIAPSMPANANRAPGFEDQARIPIREVLSELGIESSVDSGRMIVSSVRPSSLAAVSGIVAGDEIEALNFSAITPQTVFVKAVKGETLTVKRAGKRIVIRFGSNSDRR